MPIVDDSFILMKTPDDQRLPQTQKVQQRRKIGEATAHENDRRSIVINDTQIESSAH